MEAIKKEELQNGKSCPNCKSVYTEKDARYCLYCGSKLVNPYKACPRCKKIIKEGTSFCPDCGCKLVSDKKKNYVASYVWGFISIIFILLILTILNIDPKSSQNRVEQKEIQPDSIQLAIMKNANITFNDLKKLEEEFSLKVTEIKTGIVPVNPLQEAPMFVISLINDKNKDVIWKNQYFAKWRIVIGNEVLPSHSMYNHPALDDPISHNQTIFIDNAGLEVQIGNNRIKDENIFIDILNRNSEKVLSIPVNKESISSIKSVMVR